MQSPVTLRILVIDAHRRLPPTLGAGLEERGHAVVVADSVEAGRHLLAASAFDVLVIDREEHGDGLTEPAKRSALRPTVVVLANGIPDQSGAGLSAVESISIPELCEQIVASARRQRISAPEHYSIGPYQLNIQKRRLYRDQTEIQITRSEYLLLRTLALHRGEVLSRRQLMQAVWGTAAMSHGTLDTLVNTVRAKLHDLRHGRISAVAESGYKLLDEPPASPPKSKPATRQHKNAPSPLG